MVSINMRSPFFALLLVSCAAHARSQEVSSSWIGLWTENAVKSSIFFPATLFIQKGPGDTYFVSEDGGKRFALSCTAPRGPGQSCLLLTARWPEKEGAQKEGVEYKVTPRGTELEVDRWRVVPDGTRPTDTDTYVRSTPGKGYVGAWRKIRSTEAPTLYRISRDGDRFTFAVPNGELTITFSLRQAATPQGAYASADRENGNRYKILSPLALLEESLSEGRVIAQSVIMLSADGQTMTEEHTDAGPSPHPLRIVYDHSR